MSENEASIYVIPCLKMLIILQEMHKHRELLNCFFKTFFTNVEIE
jgi:hypothetical protein